MKRICVFCGSSPGSNPAYLAAAGDVGRLLAGRGIGLVYGGASVGLMGAVADAVLAAGGEAIGIIPELLKAKELAHPTLTELRTVGSMHERKALMAELADGFIALPGGLGTMEEFCEILTWNQLGIIAKPCGLLNTLGYYDTLAAFLDHAVDQRFVREEQRRMVLLDDDPARLLASLAACRVPIVDKWLDRGSM
jgi:uncharacterized protein (TIGR00730 family)